jgi:hypothetical protein
VVLGDDLDAADDAGVEAGQVFGRDQVLDDGAPAGRRRRPGEGRGDVGAEQPAAVFFRDGRLVFEGRTGQRNVWLDQRLQALSAEDRAVIARATALLASIADS